MDTDEAKDFDLYQNSYIDLGLPENFLTRLLLLTDENIINFRNDVRRELILVALSYYSEGDSFTADQLIKDIDVRLGCKILYDDLTIFLDHLMGQKIVLFVDNKNYKLIQKVETADFSQITEGIWQDFLIILQQEHRDFDIFLDKDAKKVFDNIILDILKSVASTFEELRTQVDLLHEIDIQQIIENQLWDATLTPLTKKKFPDAVKKYLLTNSDNLNEFLFNAYFNIIKFKILEHEQEDTETDFSKNLIDNMHFLICDSSFLVPLLCPTDVKYPLTISVVNKCKQYKIPIYFLPPTKNEMARLIEASRHEMKGFFIGKKNSFIQNQFVEDFKNQLDDNPAITWDIYHEFLTHWEKQLIKKYDISILPVDVKYELDEIIREFIRKTLKILGRSAKYDIPRNEHDAYCLGALSYLRSQRQNKKGHQEMGPWFVAFDNTLARADAIYHENKKDEYLVVQPRSLLNYFIIFSKVRFDKKDKALVCEALLRYTFTKASHSISLDQFCKLITFKFGLSTQDFEIVQQIIFAHPLKGEINKALEHGRGDLAVENLFKIVKDIEFIETITEKKEFKEKTRAMAEKIKTVERERDEWKIKYDTIQENLILFNQSAEQTAFLELVDLFEKEKVMEKGLIPPLPQNPTKEKIVEWLKKAKEAIETSETLQRGVIAAIGIIDFLLKTVKTQ